MLFVTDKIQGFKTIGPVLIKDGKGKPFYFNPSKKDLYFNLPPGRYETKNNLKEAAPLVYALPNLPPPERKLKFPKKLKVLVSNNPAKCTVILDKGLIIFDKAFFRSLTLPEKAFILWHELGHYYYGGKDFKKDYTGYIESEKYCDLFASKMMLKNGYNPTQIVIASRKSLGIHSEERKAATYEQAKNFTTI